MYAGKKSVKKLTVCFGSSVQSNYLTVPYESCCTSAYCKARKKEEEETEWLYVVPSIQEVER